MPNLPPHALSHGPFGGDSVGPWDPANGIYIYDDMSWGGGGVMDSRYQNINHTNGTFLYGPSLGVAGAYDAFHRCQGAVELNTGVSGGSALTRGSLGMSANPGMNGYQLGYGPCTLKTRLAIGHGLNLKGNTAQVRFGFFQQTSALSTAVIATVPASLTAVGAVILEYSPDNNGGNLRLGYTVGGGVGNLVSLTYVNCTNAVPNFGQFEWWELDIDASLNITASLNGNIIATAATAAPNNVPMCPIWTNYHAATFSPPSGLLTIDDLYLYYPYNRR
jgi:hypothetical protein